MKYFLLILPIALGALFYTNRADAANLLSKNGLHWHTTLKISKNGKPITVPAEIGLGITHNPIHTHEEDNVIHLEFGGRVTKENTRLQRFFEAWNIAPSSLGANMIGIINGATTTDPLNHEMRDGDIIELKYE